MHCSSPEASSSLSDLFYDDDFTPSRGTMWAAALFDIFLKWWMTRVIFVFAVRRSVQCAPPLIRSNCDAGENGLECARTCQNLDLPCVSLACIPGCLCPPGTVGGVLFLCMCAERNKTQKLLKFNMLTDSFQVRHRKECIAPEQCPCFHNNRPYASGQTILVDCNTWYRTR